MRQIRRHVLLGAAVLALTACGAVTAPDADAVEDVTTAAQESAAQESATAPSFGTCDQVPTADMADRPVAAALAESPVLTTLTSALAGLPELPGSLEKARALTVYAPTDAAFDTLKKAIGDKAFAALLADRDRLDGLLSYHVSPRRLGAKQLVAAGKTTELAYGDVTVSGTPDALTLTSTDGTVASVLCGNVQTANATVFVIDKVLLPVF